MRVKFLPEIFLYVSVVLCGYFQGCTKTPAAPNPQGSGNSIDHIIASVSNTTLFNSLLTRTGLDSTLNGPGPFTVFVPTDTAFAAAGFNAAVISNSPDSTLFRLTTYAIIDGSSLGSATLPAGPNSKIVTAGGDSIYVSNNTNGIFVNGIRVTETDVPASNGTINAVMSPLIPPSGALLQTLQSDTIYSFMSAAIARASLGTTNLDSILTGSPFTIFVPVNSAFPAAGYSTINDINNADPDSLAKMVTYHVISQRVFSSDFDRVTGPITLNGSSFEILQGVNPGIQGTGNILAFGFKTRNIMASNGVIHIISGVLKP